MKHNDVVVREAPGTRSRKLGTLYVGDKVTIVNFNYDTVCSHTWAQIYWPLDQYTSYGYVANEYLP